MLPGILDQLPFDGALEVYRAVIGELKQIQQRIRHFVANLLLHHLVAMGCARLLWRHPLEYLSKFSHLDHQCHGQILGCVKLLSVALGRELFQGLLEFRKVENSKEKG
jgi:hypothetical protein